MPILTTPFLDIVMVGSDSIEAVQVTHANDFDARARDQYAEVLSAARLRLT